MTQISDLNGLGWRCGSVAEESPTRWDLLRRIPQDKIAQQLQRRTRHQWIVWFGHTTGRYWAMRRPYGTIQPTLREFVNGTTAEQLWSAMTAVDAAHRRSW